MQIWLEMVQWTNRVLVCNESRKILIYCEWGIIFFINKIEGFFIGKLDFKGHYVNSNKSFMQVSTLDSSMTSTKINLSSVPNA